ncbi:hypothetical protein B4088_1911 [Bacillus cereus]|uniref:Uncharacterized protein n=1 Tax=Bacillus cereus TaxID=1396 RepID=A0A164PNK3_BACCE|nr:hypothetical protein B4088_1911 [Bacillus cereus]
MKIYRFTDKSYQYWSIARKIKNRRIMEYHNAAVFFML